MANSIAAKRKLSGSTDGLAIKVTQTATAADGNIVATIPSKSGLYLVVPWLILQNSKVVKAFAWTANVITIHWRVNTITDA